MAAGCKGQTRMSVAEMFFLPSLGLTMRAAVMEPSKRMVERGVLSRIAIGVEVQRMQFFLLPVSLGY